MIVDKKTPTFTANLIIASFLFAGCTKTIALLTAPKKTADYKITPLSKKAERKFWSSLHSGKYDEVDDVIYQLQAAYLENPNNGIIATHLGFAYMWKASERRQNPKLLKDPRSINGFDLASAAILHADNFRMGYFFTGTIKT